MQLSRYFRYICAICALVLALTRPAMAHPMGNFSINHYTRFAAEPGELQLRYVLDFAEIPAAQQMEKLDSDGDGKWSEAEKTAYLRAEVPQFVEELSLQISDKKIALKADKSELEVRPGAGGLPTLLVKIDMGAALSRDAPLRVVYTDGNFSGRTGWKEIIANAKGKLAIADSDASTQDQSRELTVFPVSADIVPPRQESARFTLVTAPGASGATGAVGAETTAPEVETPATNRNTPQNRFTQSIAESTLTPAAIGWGLLFAFAFGAAHALSPGHGKTMVAAYLVGSRGTTKHAVSLGAIVTLTHTAGVFALGFIVLFASQYILPDKLSAMLGTVSGLIIFGVGIWLFMSRWQFLQNGRSSPHGEHSHAHDGHTHSHGEHDHSHGEHDHSHGEHDHSHGEHDHSHGESTAMDDELAGSQKEHTHAHGEHSHDEAHGHSHGLHVHSHGGKAHSHAVPEGPITAKTLVALGISGGIVPCPEALVVLLAAVKLQRIGYGMVLIVAFSLGLAAALIAIGLLVVSARQRLARVKGLGEDSVIVRYLPLGSAAVITIIGAALTLQATMN